MTTRLVEIVQDERGALSSTRVIALAASAAVIFALLVDLFVAVALDPTVVGAVTGLALGSLTKAAIDKRSPHGVVEANIRMGRATGAIPALLDEP